MKYLWVIGLFMVTASPCIADFTRYQVILDRMPFGVEAPPAPPPGVGANGKPVPAAESFTKTLKMCAVTRHALTGRLQVGLVDTTSKKNYFLTVGDSEDGITLVEADYDGEKALLRKDDQEVWLGMSDVASMAAAAPAAPTRPSLPGIMAGAGGGVRAPALPRPPSMPAAPSAPPAPPSPPGERYATEREAVMAARRARLGVTTNAVSGEALKKHIEQYQMDLIRSGGAKGPPLPIQLTPEMDQQLVREGVLPPQPP